MKCPTCGYAGPPHMDLWCGNEECNDFIGDPEIEREMEVDAMLLDYLGGAFDEDPALKEWVRQDLRAESARRIDASR